MPCNKKNVLKQTFFKDWKVILLRYFNPVGAHESGLIGEDPSGIPNNLMPYISQANIHSQNSIIIINDFVLLGSSRTTR